MYNSVRLPWPNGVWAAMSLGLSALLLTFAFQRVKGQRNCSINLKESQRPIDGIFITVMFSYCSSGGRGGGGAQGDRWYIHVPRPLSPLPHRRRSLTPKACRSQWIAIRAMICPSPGTSSHSPPHRPQSTAVHVCCCRFQSLGCVCRRV